MSNITTDKNWNDFILMAQTRGKEETLKHFEIIRLREIDDNPEIDRQIEKQMEGNEFSTEVFNRQN